MAATPAGGGRKLRKIAPATKTKATGPIASPFQGGKVADPLKKKLVKAGHVAKQPKQTDRQLLRDRMDSGKPLPLAHSALQAPVLKVLQQTTRPAHAIAGAIDAAVTHKPILKAAKKGFSDVNAPGFSKVLKDIGAPKIVQKAGGFVGDVALDPTTYVTLGVGSVARKAAVDAAKATATKAAKAGMSEAGQVTVAQQAARRAASIAPVGKGVAVKFGGREVPGVRSATAAGGRVLKKAGSKAPGKSAASATRDAVREVRPTLHPAGADPAQYKAARQAARQARATATRGQAAAEGQARTLRKRIGEKNYTDVVAAVERNDFKGLPPELASAAHDIRSSYKGAKRLRKRAGIGEGDVTKAKGEGAATGYFPHAQETPLAQGLGLVEHNADVPVQTAGTLRKPGSASKRTDKRPIGVQNPERVAAGNDPFSTNIPLVHLNYQRGTAKAVAAGELEKNLAAAGRRLDPRKPNTIKAGEGIYHLGYDGKGTPFKLREIAAKDWEAGSIPKTGQFVALHRKTVDSAREYGKATQAESTWGRGIDKVTRGFKGLATATPAFHARNAVGDTQLAYLQQSGAKLPRNLAQGVKANRALSKSRTAVETFAHGVDHGGKTIKVAGKRMPIGQFIELAQQHGVVQSGQIGAELRDLAGDTAVAGAKRLRRTRRLTNIPGVKALTTGRENVVRMATFKDGLDKGMSPADAASHSLESSIDYADLTRVERQYGRRLMPFYTFTARALPFQAKRLVTNPGKFATLEKVREDLGDTNQPLDAFSEYTQRQAPIVIGGKAVTDSLPINLLNELPVNLKPGEYGTEIGKFIAGLANPIIKDPIELQMNKSFALRSDIQDPQHPLVAAPDWVAIIPQALRDKLGITHDYIDKKTGKKQWAWPGRLNYKVRSFMLGPLSSVNQLSSSGTNQVGQDAGAKAAAALTGVRVTPPDATSQTINGLFRDRAKLQEKQAAIRQGLGPYPSGNPQYRKLSFQIKQLNNQIAALQAKRSGVKPPLPPGVSQREIDMLVKEQQQTAKAPLVSERELEMLRRDQAPPKKLRKVK